jgi:hypothetical protein
VRGKVRKKVLLPVYTIRSFEKNLNFGDVTFRKYETSQETALAQHFSLPTRCEVWFLLRKQVNTLNESVKSVSKLYFAPPDGKVRVKGGQLI